MQTGPKEAKEEESTKLESSVKVDEKNVLVESQVAEIEIDKTCPIMKELPSPDQDVDKIKILTAEVENLKVPLCLNLLLWNYHSSKLFPLFLSS